MRSCCEGGAEERNTETSLVGMDLEEASVELMERVLESLGDEIDIDDLVSDGEGDDDTTDYEDSNELRAVQLPETSESQQKQDIVKDRLGSSPLPMSNPMDSGNVSSETMSQDLPVGNQRVSGESAYAEKCSAFSLKTISSRNGYRSLNKTLIKAIDNIVERSLTDEFSSKQSQLNPRKSRTTTPSGTSLSGQEEDDEGEGELMAKMFTRSMGIAAVGDDEKGWFVIIILSYHKDP
ncbi:unnamed protein product [Anisakis simplex]|uniref:Uncharacterized protein n=1 Tax=Anisakis simplex TaxID=6269 RepID=A0A0M3JAK3_ANISI|nr:unnamed protein product [Anisakis simplex]